MKVNVGVFFGGISVEHEISIISALQVIHALDDEKYQVIPIYISKEGVFYTGEKLREIENYADIGKLLSKSHKINIINDNNECLIIKYPAKFGSGVIGKIDVAFPVVHGTNVEDGTLQGYLELLRVPYVGSDVLGSAIGMDKILMKKALKESGIPIVDYLNFSPKDWYKDQKGILDKIQKTLSFPLIVKPSNLGSSVGVKKVNNADELEEAVTLVQSFTNRILVEKLVGNLKEINCSVLGDYEKVETSVCEEPVSNDEILSYKDKYMSKTGTGKGMSSLKRKLPAYISEEMTQKVKALAASTFQTLGCCGVARIDFLLDMKTASLYVNEINTIPGSLAFYLWEASGKPFKNLLDDLINLAFKRARERKSIMFSYNVNILSLKAKGK